MKLLYTGKTKNVFGLENGDYLLQFKDDATGENGVFDPGANQVGLQIPGSGKAAVALSEFFFGKIAEAGIPTHFVSADSEKAQMVVKPARLFGKGLEVICRLKATGSFKKRYGDYCKEGEALDYFVEATLKDDGREDPPISRDALAMLNIATPQEYDSLADLVRKATKIVKEELAKKNIELYDIKMEFGRAPSGTIILVDEISGGNMRAYKNGAILSPMDLAPEILGR
ncbi:MAG: phosphoribosylaminoimidazolesuccinocarboxamide synthase [Treponema sp.]|nr:phosphoribosylaminoimidazolesuccinocarboxamide synthase [Treponema sp.]